MKRSRTIFSSTVFPLTIALILAAALAVPTGASAAPACAGGKTIWIVNGKATCVKSPALKPGTAEDRAAATMRDWVLSVSKPAKSGKFRIPRTLRRAVPKVARTAAKLVTLAQDAKFGPQARSAKRRKRGSPLAGIAGTGPVVDRIEIKTPEIDAGNGVTIRAVTEGVAYEDGSQSFDFRYEIKKGRDTVRYTPVLDVGDRGSFKQLKCPTAEGLVTAGDTSRSGGTAMVLRGRSVKQSRTETVETTTEARGYIGRDAKLGRVEADVTMTVKSFERGLGIEFTAKGTVGMGREGSASSLGTPSVTAKARAAGNTRAEEREFERAYAAALAKEPRVTNGLSAFGESLRQRILNNEYVWYQIPNYCVSVEFDPYPVATLNPGATRAVTAIVKANNGGGAAAAEFGVGSVARGSFVADKPQSDPGSPARFTATGAPQDENPQTVAADGVITSTAGRAQLDWSAERVDVDFPESFTGDLSAVTTDGTTRYEFSGTATYTRTSIFVSPNGFATAWYEMTAGSLTSATHEIGVGCRWKASGTGGTIESGDLELRKQPGGPVTYALLFDMKIAGAHYSSTDCPPGAELPEFDGDLNAYLYTKPPGGEFRAVGTGYQLAADDASDVTGAALTPTVASWSFAPTPN